MAAMDWYRRYLESEDWQEIRDAKLAAVDYRCERCPTYGRRGPGGMALGLQVHHLTYERCPGQERLDDLKVLCIVCHEVEHGLIEDTPEAREQALRRVNVRAADAALREVADAAIIEEEAEWWL